MNFSNFNPIQGGVGGKHNVISYREDVLSEMNFFALLKKSSGDDPLLENPRFRIALLNLLTSDKELIYPYLEYQFGFYKDG
ncbi:MAG: hypothetical protein LBI53_01865 [Candidatus Peribacteria bacterium]|nr:hypothetical protein [Candidatus Peribacteria bacterium]